ncbi:MAG: DUF456 domain-containing protein [Peptococcaceae bacterium]|nr:DUF456 domain-containing protein [Peptococcaceae bacterium]
MHVPALIIAIILFIIGLIGTVLPVLPGPILIFAGMLIYGLMTDFVSLNIFFFVLQGLILLLIFAVDYIASMLGTRHFGGTKQAGWGAIAGAIIGVIFLGPLGILIGPFLGAVLVELLQKNSLSKACRAGLGTLLGILGGTAVKLGVEVLMIAYFLFQVL